MSSIYFSYLKAFTKYADLKLKAFTSFQQIGSYAILLTEKAKKLYSRATLNKEIDIEQLIKDVTGIGSEYIKRFINKFKKT